MVHGITVPLSIAFAMAPAAVHRAMRVPVSLRAHASWVMLGGVSLFLALTWTSGSMGDGVAIAFGVVANVVCVARAYGHGSRYRHLDRLAEAVDVTAIDTLVAQWWHAQDGKHPEEAVAWTFRFCEVAIMKGRAEAALKWLDAIPSLDLPPSYRGIDAHYRCVAHLRLGDAASARKVITDAPPSTYAPVRAAREAVEALLDAIEGDESAGERARRALSGNPDARVRHVWRIVEAHALVTGEAVEDARAALQSLRADEGDDTLASIAAHGGPASQLAAKLLAADSPYR